MNCMHASVFHRSTWLHYYYHFPKFCMNSTKWARATCLFTLWNATWISVQLLNMSAMNCTRCLHITSIFSHISIIKMNFHWVKYIWFDAKCKQSEWNWDKTNLNIKGGKKRYDECVRVGAKQWQRTSERWWKGDSQEIWCFCTSHRAKIVMNCWCWYITKTNGI